VCLWSAIRVYTCHSPLTIDSSRNGIPPSIQDTARQPEPYHMGMEHHLCHCWVGPTIHNMSRSYMSSYVQVQTFVRRRSLIVPFPFTNPKTPFPLSSPPTPVALARSRAAALRELNAAAPSHPWTPTGRIPPTPHHHPLLRSRSRSHPTLR
jgi:hypothetical protein